MDGGLIVHPTTAKLLEAYLANPKQVLLLEGPDGFGKSLIARQAIAKALKLSDKNLENQPFVRIIDQETSISVEQVREMISFLSLKTIGEATYRRGLLVVDAEKMTTEAQNAFLKSLEEPPTDTIIVLTSSKPHQLLPTVLSRAKRLIIKQPTGAQIREALTKKHDQSAVDEAITKSGRSLAGIYRHLAGETEERREAFADVKQLLSKSLFQQLASIDVDYKDRAAALRLVKILSELSSLSLKAVDSKSSREQWLKFLNASLRAEKALLSSVNVKLVMTSLILALRS